MEWLRGRLRRSMLIAAGSALGVAVGPAAAVGAPSCEKAVPGELYVSHQENASDQNAGTCDEPFRTIKRGLRELGPDKTLNLRGGVYLEPVLLNGRSGTDGRPITIRSYPDEHASIEASLPRFRTLSDERWRPAKELDARANPQEFVSRHRLKGGRKNPLNRGAFVGGTRYIRLITYGSLQDLRARNERNLKLTDAFDRGRARPAGVSQGHLRASTYMGPGLWFGGGRVHVRLSHTHNGVPRLADYRGPVDARKVRLALSRRNDIALQVKRSAFVRFEDLTVRGGGNVTVRLQEVSDVEFDHVDIFSATHGVRTSHAIDTKFAHCRFLGGLPDWFFRSDAKAGTKVLPHGKGGGNGPGAQTSRALLVGAKDDTGTYIHHSEFRDGHDLYLSGSNIDFHHNWIDNLEDEALLLDAVPSRNVEVHENVITRSLSAISFAGGARAGPHHIYRNLIDLRRPTAGNRPRRRGELRALRYGHLYKSNAPDGPWELFQNTFVVSSPQPKFKATFTHLRAAKGTPRHRALNNVFVAVTRAGAARQPILLVPSAKRATVSDGNAYFRIGAGSRKLYRKLPDLFFDNLRPLRAMGYEQNGIQGDPGFRRLGADGALRPTDDFRLTPGPASTHGVSLPDPLAALDPWDVPGSPSIGAYGADERRLLVGVDGRRAFPSSE